MTSDPRFRVPLLVVSALVLHTAVLGRLHPFGVMPDVMLLLAVAGGIAGGPARGAALGFATGLALDVLLQSPFGLSALVYTLVGYGVGVAHGGVLQSSWYLPALTALLASAGGIVLYGVAGAVLGQPLVARRLVLVATVVAVVNSLLAPAAVHAVGWALVDPADRSRLR